MGSAYGQQVLLARDNDRWEVVKEVSKATPYVERDGRLTRSRATQFQLAQTDRYLPLMISIEGFEIGGCLEEFGIGGSGNYEL